MRITARETRTKEKEAGPATGVPPIGRHHNQAIARFTDRESGPDTDPHSPFWRQAPSVFAASDTYGRIVPDHRTEIRTNWSLTSLYILFVCPYLELNLKPNPEIAAETYELWNWDVAEVFIGSDFQNIRRYKEFELSPQGEWVDLDIDLDRPRPEEGWRWSSRFEAAARIETSLRIWYGFMRIPYSAIDTRPAAAGNRLRINFFRCQGPKRNRKQIAWQPSGSTTFHVPEMFGTLKLVKS
jgi:hypothetical protein